MSSPTTFYKRPLPAGLVAFASTEGRALFQEALVAGNMAGYFALAEQFHTQADPAFCGLGTLVVVLNALSIDPGPQRPWKGPWRWFTEEHLDCCRPLAEIQRSGLTIPQLACLGRCNGARVEVHHAQAETVESFRQAVHESASTPGEPQLVVAYDRATLGQTGTGHFSPVGGYHAGRDLVLILDVARFKYPPHWVPLAELFHAMLPVDPETRRSRGYLRFWRRAEAAALCSLQATDANWRSLVCDLLNTAAPAAASIEQLLPQLLRALPPQALTLVKSRAFDGAAPPELASAQQALRQDLESTELLQLLRRIIPSSEPELDLAAVALLLLALPASRFHMLSPSLREQLTALQQLAPLPASVQAQVEHLRTQAESLEESSSCCAAESV